MAGCIVQVFVLPTNEEYIVEDNRCFRKGFRGSSEGEFRVTVLGPVYGCRVGLWVPFPLTLTH